MDPDYSTVIRYQRLGRTKSTGLNQAFGKRERGKGKGERGESARREEVQKHNPHWHADHTVTKVR